jgi:cell division protease FtsH
MIAYAGMGDKLPNICYYNNNEYGFQKPYSETTARIMDEEVLKMINEQYDRAKQLLIEHKEGHNQLAELLISREVIYTEDVEKIFGKRPWVSRSLEIMQANDEKQEDSIEMKDERGKMKDERGEMKEERGEMKEERGEMKEEQPEEKGGEA